MSEKEPIQQRHSEPGPNPFIAAREEWDDRLLNISKNSHAWKGVAFCTTALSVVLGFGIAHIGSQSKIEPYLSVVDKTTYEVSVVGPAEQAATMNDKIMKGIVQKEVRELIENFRTVVADNHAQKKIMNKVYSRISAGSAAAKAVNGWYLTRDPFKMAETQTVSPEIQSALPLSEKIWQVEWIETERNLAGDVLNKKRFRSLVTYELSPPTEDKEFRKNSIGFYVTDLSWSATE